MLALNEFIDRLRADSMQVDDDHKGSLLLQPLCSALYLVPLAHLLSSFQNFVTFVSSLVLHIFMRVCLLPPSSSFAWESEAAALSPAAGVYLLAVGKSCVRELLLSHKNLSERKEMSFLV